MTRSPRSKQLVAAAALAAVALATAAAIWRLRRAAPARSTTTLALRVTDRGTPVGARVLLFSAGGAPLRIGTLDLYGMRQGGAACAIAPGVVGSWDGLIVARGLGDVPVGGDPCGRAPAIPYGVYRVWAWRGVEYERWEGTVDLSAGRGVVGLAIPLERAWTPHGALAADLHVHARASNDSTLPNPQRVIAQAAAGVQVIALSDHNTSGDLDAEIAALGLEDVIASIASNELTSERLHVGVYPVQLDRAAPRGGGPPAESIVRASPQELLALARGLPGRPVVQINHPRFRVTALYDDARWDGVSWPPPFPTDFDAVEVLAGYTAFNAPGDRRFDDGVRDFYTFIDHGRLIAPLGNSDTHDLNWVLDGTARSYVFVDDPRAQPFDEAAFIAAIRGRRVVATTGPWLDVEVAAQKGAPTVGPGQALAARDGKVWVDVTVWQARFVRTERIRVTVGGPAGPRLAETIDVPPGARQHAWAGAIEVGAADTWIGITADGDTPMPPELTGTYQQDRWKRPGVTPFSIASPILVDADGDRRWRRGGADLPLSYFVTPLGRSSQ
ncbi:MAG TPA: CehA/McbA family metallohydrolase [Kofleriaceae bacterium]|nr:CehA/McbA family metallohydrolase [Kofleriaceae bacterium]